MIKGTLFDFDGTLMNSLPYYVTAYDRALQKIGFKFDSKKIALTCFNKRETAICESLGVPEKTEEFKAAYFSAIKELSKEAPLFDDAIETLDFIRNKKIRIAIITFAYRWYIDEKIKQFNLKEYVDIVISSDEVKNAKPDPEAVLKVLNKFKIAPQESLVVGDAKNDILMGKAAKAKTALFAPKSYNSYYDLNEIKQAEPDYVIDKISKLKDII